MKQTNEKRNKYLENSIVEAKRFLEMLQCAHSSFSLAICSFKESEVKFRYDCILCVLIMAIHDTKEMINFWEREQKNHTKTQRIISKPISQLDHNEKLEYEPFEEPPF